MSKKKDKQPKKVIEQVERKGRCLYCNKPMVKNHMTCVSCRKKKRLMSKANRRGKRKDYYLK